jgi:hypothetical protein
MITGNARHTGRCNKSALIVSLQGHKCPAGGRLMKYRQFRRRRPAELRSGDGHGLMPVHSASALASEELILPSFRVRPARAGNP